MGNERAYDWDDQIQNDSSDFVVLPEGEYPFEVMSFERARHDGSAKLPPCNKAIVHIQVDGGELGTAKIKHNLFLHSKCEGLLCEFFRAIGMRKHGEPLRMNWQGAIASVGRCKVGIRKGEGQYAGKEYNEIKKFLDPEDRHVAQQQATPAAGKDWKWTGEKAETPSQTNQTTASHSDQFPF